MAVRTCRGPAAARCSRGMAAIAPWLHLAFVWHGVRVSEPVAFLHALELPRLYSTTILTPNIPMEFNVFVDTSRPSSSIQSPARSPAPPMTARVGREMQRYDGGVRLTAGCLCVHEGKVWAGHRRACMRSRLSDQCAAPAFVLISRERKPVPWQQLWGNRAQFLRHERCQNPLGDRLRACVLAHSLHIISM